MKQDHLVQPIIVHTSAYRDEARMISDAAVASVLSMTGVMEDVQKEWFLTGQRKSARRVKKERDLIDAQRDSIGVRVGSAVAGRVLPYRDFTPVLRRAQVSMWTEPEKSAPADSPFGTVTFNEDVNLTIGKRIVSASHALVLHYLSSGVLPTAGDLLDIRYGSSPGDGAVTVTDNGVTEVSPGTVTCWFNKK